MCEVLTDVEVAMAVVMVMTIKFEVMVPDRNKIGDIFYFQEKAIHNLALAKGRFLFDDDHHHCCSSSVLAYESQQRHRCSPSI